MIEFKDVVLQYHYDDFALLKGVNFALTGGVNTILADTQSGKSSICKLLTKDVAPNGGEITVDGVDIGCITNADLGILYLPSKPTFFANRSVRYNIEYPLNVRKVAKNECRATAEKVATALNIDFLNEKVKKLTEKQCKTVALARGLTVERKTVLFDDFFEIDGDVTQTVAHIDDVLSLFGNATCVILTSDTRLARGHTVVLDGGVTVYDGDVEGAKKVISELVWIDESIRSK